MAPIARLHLITPNSTDRSVVDRSLRALEAGAPWIQVRTKDATDRARLDLARELTLLCEARYATCVIDDRVDIAVAVDAAGVHLGADDLPVDVARSIMGPQAVVGATCRTAEDARRAVDAGASYVGVGPVFETTTKSGLPDPIGLSGLQAVTAGVDVPVIAISGITPARVAMVLEAGAHGVAVVDAVYGAPDIADAVAAFLAELGPVPAPGGAPDRPSGRVRAAEAQP